MYGGTPFLQAEINNADVQKRPGFFEMVKRVFRFQIKSQLEISIKQLTGPSFGTAFQTMAALLPANIITPSTTMSLIAIYRDLLLQARTNKIARNGRMSILPQSRAHPVTDIALTCFPRILQDEASCRNLYYIWSKEAPTPVMEVAKGDIGTNSVQQNKPSTTLVQQIQQLQGQLTQTQKDIQLLNQQKVPPAQIQNHQAELRLLQTKQQQTQSQITALLKQQDLIKAAQPSSQANAQDAAVQAVQKMRASERALATFQSAVIRVWRAYNSTDARPSRFNPFESIEDSYRREMKMREYLLKESPLSQQAIPLDSKVLSNTAATTTTKRGDSKQQMFLPFKPTEFMWTEEQNL